MHTADPEDTKMKKWVQFWIGTAGISIDPRVHYQLMVFLEVWKSCTFNQEGKRMKRMKRIWEDWQLGFCIIISGLGGEGDYLFDTSYLRRKTQRRKRKGEKIIETCSRVSTSPLTRDFYSRLLKYLPWTARYPLLFQALR